MKLTKVLLLAFLILLTQDVGITGKVSVKTNFNFSKSMIRETNLPSYVKLHEQGILKKRGEELWQRMSACDLCPRNCGVNRLKGQRGKCNANSTLEISSHGPHFGEERELVGPGGSGTIFMTNCALLCVFCFNYEISQLRQGKSTSIDDLANIMIRLQQRGCSNINFVTPTHYIPHILLAIDKAVPKGLRLPIVYNTGGYEIVETLSYLDGVVDIYLPDFKYGCNTSAGKYSIGAWDYAEYCQSALLEMHRQVGTLQVDPTTGLARRGLMIRHLIMPNNAACSDKVLAWIANRLPADTYVNLMAQYTPAFNASDYPEINRRITMKEYREVIDLARKLGLTNIRGQLE